MIKNNKYIEIVRSNMPGLSSMGQGSVDACLGVLSQQYASVRASNINNLSDLEALVARKPDLVFLGMEFLPSDPNLGISDPNKIWLADYLEEAGITYTGSNQAAHDLQRSKPLAKQQILNAGLQTAAYQVVQKDQLPKAADISLAFPVFIKPTNRGGGLGVDSQSLVNNFEELLLKVGSIRSKYDADSLVEEYLPGREFSVAVLRQEKSSNYSVMPIELIPPTGPKGERILSGQVKASDTEQVMAVIDEVLKAKVSTLAEDVFYALGARDYGRIDIRLDKHGEPQFLEANLIPSLISGYGSFPKACLLNVGLDYEPMILRITKLALDRNATNTQQILVNPVSTDLLGLPLLEAAI